MNKQKSDDVLNEYWAEPRRFADLFNGVLFGGRQMINPKELSPMDTANPTTVATKKTKKLTEDVYSLTRYRDLIKMAGYGAEFQIITAIENQNKIHYAMPVRGLLYDALGYTKQCKDITKSHSNKDYADAAEYLSGLTKEDEIIPIFTITLYYGEDTWDGPQRLSDMMRLDKVLLPYYNDYSINLVPMREYRKYNLFHTEVRQFFRLMRGLKNLESLHQYMIEDEEEIIDIDTVRAVAIAVGAKDLQKLAAREQKEGCVKMCTAIEELKKEGRTEGKIEAIFELLEDFGEMPEDVKTRIQAEKDMEVLHKWTKLAARTESIEEFIQKM